MPLTEMLEDGVALRHAAVVAASAKLSSNSSFSSADATESNAASVSRVAKVPLMLRTCPLTHVVHQFPPHAVANMNELLISLAGHHSPEVLTEGNSSMELRQSPGAQRREAWRNSVSGVLDWARIVTGFDSLQPDGYHQNERSQLAFLQMILNEMYLLGLSHHL